MNNYLTYHIGNMEIVSGSNSIQQLPNLFRKIKFNKVLIVTDKDLASIAYFKQVIQMLIDQNIEYVLYDKITPNPKDYEVMTGVEVYKKNACDVVIGIGGGSSMDASKCISVMVRHEGDVMDYGRSNPNRKFFIHGREKLILIPTTSGTGSEVSPHAVITNTKIDRKSDIMESLFYADYIFMDPKFALSMSKELTAQVGIDALVHAIEAYTCKKMTYQFDPFHDSIALKAIELVALNLRKAYFCGDVDLEARENMMWAAMMAGFVLDLDVGCIHGMAGSIQKYHHEVTHGQSVGMLLPSGMNFNLLACPARFKNIAVAFGIDVSRMSEMEAAKASVVAVKQLLHDIEFVKLSDFVENISEIEEYYEVASRNSCNKNNPRYVSPMDAKKIFVDAYNDAW